MYIIIWTSATSTAFCVYEFVLTDLHVSEMTHFAFIIDPIFCFFFFCAKQNRTEIKVCVSVCMQHQWIHWTWKRNSWECMVAVALRCTTKYWKIRWDKVMPAIYSRLCSSVYIPCSRIVVGRCGRKTIWKSKIYLHFAHHTECMNRKMWIANFLFRSIWMGSCDVRRNWQ